MTKSKADYAINILLFLSILVFIAGFARSRRSGVPVTANPAQGDAAMQLPERAEAISEAEKNGQKDYSYSSGFMPGIGGGVSDQQ